MCQFPDTVYLEEDRQRICQEFTAASFDKQKDFILTRVKRSDVERKWKRKESVEERPEKRFSYGYTFLQNSEEKRVCKAFFFKHTLHQ